MSVKAVPKKKEGGSDNFFDLEQQFVLRLPPGPAEELRQDVQLGTPLLKDKLSIELESDMRHGRVRYENYIFNAKLVDLPCVMESLKTVDKKTFYKTADICQMLVCSTEDEVNVEETDSPKKKDKDKKFLWNHGITPPLKNVRKRRFRKTLKKKYMDQPELEKEVRRLFRYDAEAIDVKWEVLTEDEKPLSDSGQTSGHIQASGTISNTDGTLRRQDTSGLDVASFFGELSSSDDEKDLNIMDSGEDDASRGPFMHQIGDASLDRPASESQDIGGDPDTEDLQEKLSELVQQLEEIREKRLEMEAQMAEEDNDLMRDKLREDLERFLQEESQKEQEYEILSAMLNQG